MQIPISLTLAVGFVTIVSLCPRLGEGKSSSNDESAAVQQVISAYMDAFNQHDPRGVAALFAPDGDFTNALQVTTHGQNDIEEHLKPVFATRLKNARRTYSLRRIQFLQPEVSVATTDYRLEGETKPDGTPGPTRNGLLTWILTKPHDKWLIDTLEEAEVPSLCATPNQ